MKQTIIRDDTSDEVEIKLRVIDLKEDEFLALGAKLVLLNIPHRLRTKESRRIRKDSKMGSSILIDISSENQSACRKILQGENKGTRDIWISYFTEYDHGGFTIPDWVTSIANDFHLPIQISYMGV